MHNRRITDGRPRTVPGVRDYLPLDQVAELLGLDIDQALELVRAGDLPGTWVPDRKTWYVDRPDVEAFATSRP